MSDISYSSFDLEYEYRADRLPLITGEVLSGHRRWRAPLRALAPNEIRRTT